MTRELRGDSKTANWKVVQHLKGCGHCYAILTFTEPVKARFCPTLRALLEATPTTILRKNWIEFLRTYEREWFPWEWVASFRFATPLDPEKARERSIWLWSDLECNLGHHVGWAAIYPRQGRKITSLYGLVIQVKNGDGSSVMKSWEKQEKGVAQIVQYDPSLGAESRLAQAAAEGLEVQLFSLYENAQYYKSLDREAKEE